MSTPLAVFGPGILILTRTDLTPSTPINVGFVNEFSIDAAATTKQLYGQKQYPLVAARGTIKVTGKAKAAVISGLAWNTAFYGQSSFSSTGAGIFWNVDSTFSLSTAATTLSVGSSLTFDADLGVKYASGANAGLPFQRVSSGSESSGKYSVTTSTAVGLNVVNFSAADTTSLAAGTTIPIKITYTSLTGAGQSLVVTNALIGTTPTFQIDYWTNLNQPASKPFVVRSFQAIGSKHTLAFKLEDFMMPEIDFDIFANAADQVYTLVFPEVS